MNKETLDKYVANINKYKLLSREEEKDLLLAYKNGDTKAGQKVVTHNLRFVVKVAHSFKGYGQSMHDLIQEGNKAMLVALKKFDPDKDVKFCSYAVWWIKAYMSNFVLHNHSIVRFGTNYKEKKLFYSLKKTREILENCGIEDINKGLAEHFGITEEEVSLNLSRLNPNKVVTLGKEGAGLEGSDDKKEMTIFKQAPDKNVLQDEFYEKTFLNNKIMETLDDIRDTLSEREMCILKERLTSDDPIPLAEIGKKFGVSRQRISQIEEQLVAKLKHTLWEYEGTV